MKQENKDKQIINNLIRHFMEKNESEQFSEKDNELIIDYLTDSLNEKDKKLFDSK